MKTLEAVGNKFFVATVQKKLACRRSSNSETVCFKLNRYSGKTDLSECYCTIKTKNSEGKSDLAIPEVTADDKKLYINWTLSSGATAAIGELLVQVQLKKIFDDSRQNINWQSNIMEFEITDSLGAADEIADQDSTLFQQWEEKVNTLYSDAAADVQAMQVLQTEVQADADAVVQQKQSVEQTAAQVTQDAQATAESAQSAQASAQNAQASAMQAQTSASDADTAQGLAKGYSDAAKTYSEAASVSAQSAQTSSQSAQQQAETAQGIVTQAQQKVDAFSGYTKAEIDNGFANALIGEATGQIISLDDVQPNTNLRSLLVTGQMVETGSGDKSLDHPYQLCGTGSLEISGSQNLFDASSAFCLNLYATGDSTFKTSTLSPYGVFGLCVGSNLMMKNPVPVIENCWITYSFQLKLVSGSCSSKLNYIGIALSETESGTGTVVKAASPQNPVVTSDYQTYSGSVYIPAGMQYAAPIIQISGATSNAVFQIADFQLNYGQTAAEYTAFRGLQKIALPQKLYSLPDGMADTYDAVAGIGAQAIHSGLLTADSWTVVSSYFDSSLIGFSCHPDDRSDGTPVAYCDKFPIEATGTPSKDRELLWWAGGIGIAIFKSRLSGWDDSLTDAQKIALFTNWLVTNPIMVFYRMNSLIQIQNTPQAFPVCAPNFSVCAGAGNITAGYICDNNIAFQKLRSEVAALQVATEKNSQGLQISYSYGK